jgi:hypothetical protein
MSNFAKLAQILLENKSVPYSKFTEGIRKKHKSAFDTGLLSLRRSGAGRVVVTEYPERFTKYLENHYPSGLESAITGAKNRTEAVAYFRNAKKKNITDREALLFKAYSSSNDLLYLNDIPLPAKEWCNMAGIGALQLCDTDSITLKGKIGLIENIDVFWFFEKLDLELDIIFYSGGRLSNRFMNKLIVNNSFSLMHFGDYDPVGIDEYLKRKKVVPATTFFIPENIEALFANYGKKELLYKDNTRSILNRLRSETDEIIISLIKLIDAYNCGLEQEALLI